MSDRAESDAGGAPSNWCRLSARQVADCRIFTVAEKRFRHPARGTEGDFFVIESPDWVNVLAITADHRIVLVNQFRFGIEIPSWEVPGGVMEEGEDPIVAGLRELQEETGYTAKRVRILGSLHPNPAIQDNRCHIVLAEGAVQTADTAWDPHEEIEVKAVPIGEAFSMAHAGGITHSLALNALLLYYPEWLKIQARQRPSR